MNANVAGPASVKNRCHYFFFPLLLLRNQLQKAHNPFHQPITSAWQCQHVQKDAKHGSKHFQGLVTYSVSFEHSVPRDMGYATALNTRPCTYQCHFISYLKLLLCTLKHCIRNLLFWSLTLHFCKEQNHVQYWLWYETNSSGWVKHYSFYSVNKGSHKFEVIQCWRYEVANKRFHEFTYDSHK